MIKNFRHQKGDRKNIYMFRFTYESNGKSHTINIPSTKLSEAKRVFRRAIPNAEKVSVQSNKKTYGINYY